MAARLGEVLNEKEVVDDEELLKPIVKTMVEMLGLSNFEVSNNREALELFNERSADICLVITDFGMPVMDGYQLSRELKILAPKLPVIVSSGFGNGEISSRLDCKEISGIVSKPYRIDTLGEVLQRTLV